jgi:predicted aspartyl protease
MQSTCEEIMGTATMGKVLVRAKIENLFDVESREKGFLAPDKVRGFEISDALVDTGASTLLLPKRLIQQLGLRHYHTRQARGGGGTVPMPIYSSVWLTIEGRECAVDVGEVSDDLPVLIGQIPLEALDLVVDCKGQRLIGNPAHGGEHIMEAY